MSGKVGHVHPGTGLEECVDHGTSDTGRPCRHHDASSFDLLANRGPTHGSKIYFPRAMPRLSTSQSGPRTDGAEEADHLPPEEPLAPEEDSTDDGDRRVPQPPG